MDNWSKSFPYDSLNTLKSDFRLIRLQPSQETDPIACSLVAAKLDDSPMYEAPSYEWGCASPFNSPSFYIKLNGLDYPVRENPRATCVPRSIPGSFGSMRSVSLPNKSKPEVWSRGCSLLGLWNRLAIIEGPRTQPRALPTASSYILGTHIGFQCSLTLLGYTSEQFSFPPSFQNWPIWSKSTWPTRRSRS